MLVISGRRVAVLYSTFFFPLHWVFTAWGLNKAGGSDVGLLRRRSIASAEAQRPGPLRRRQIDLDYVDARGSSPTRSRSHEREEHYPKTQYPKKATAKISQENFFQLESSGPCCSGFGRLDVESVERESSTSTTTPTTHNHQPSTTTPTTHDHQHDHQRDHQHDHQHDTTTTTTTTSHTSNRWVPPKCEDGTHYDVDRGGQDLQLGGWGGRFPTSLPTLWECMAKCALDVRCGGVVWVKTDIGRPNCALKAIGWTLVAPFTLDNKCDAVQMTDACKAAVKAVEKLHT